MTPPQRDKNIPTPSLVCMQGFPSQISPNASNSEAQSYIASETSLTAGTASTTLSNPAEPSNAIVLPPKTDKGRPHVCATCQRSFARLEHLKRHERSHTREKPFKCPECERCFARRDLLLRHQQKLHQQSGYSRNNAPSANSPYLSRRHSTSNYSVQMGFLMDQDMHHAHKRQRRAFSQQGAASATSHSLSASLPTDEDSQLNRKFLGPFSERQESSQSYFSSPPEQSLNQPFAFASPEDSFDWRAGFENTMQNVNYNEPVSPALSASSFGSADSGVSHPPRSKREGKKIIQVRYSDIVGQSPQGA